jgi:hypothetical protein
MIHTQKDGAERFDMNSYRVQELMPIFTLMADVWRAHPHPHLQIQQAIATTAATTVAPSRILFTQQLNSC